LGDDATHQLNYTLPATAHALTKGDAYVIPPHLKTALTDCSEDLELLEVSLPADFETYVHPDENLHEPRRAADRR
jgi:hypothetical protein